MPLPDRPAPDATEAPPGASIAPRPSARSADLAVASRPPSGASLASRPPATSRPPSAEASRPSQPRLLLVTGDEGLARLVRRLFDDPGHPGELAAPPVAVTVAPSLALGLDAARGLRPVVVLVGLGLVDAELLDAVHELRGAAPRAIIGVLARFHEEGAALDALRVGADEVLQVEGLDLETLGGLARVAAERHHLDECRAFLAQHDLLTGLENRDALLQRLGRALARGARRGEVTGAVVVDLDGFSSVNDAHGFAIGDAVLQEVAARLAASVRETDVVARLDGDAFGLVLEGLRSRDEAGAVVERLREALRGPLILGEGAPRISLGFSTGLAFAPRDAGEAELLLERAEAAVRRAKDRRRLGAGHEEQGPVCGGSASQVGIEELRSAVRDGRIGTVYQRQVELSAEPRVIGYEALLRLRDVNGGTRDAEAFLPALLETDLVLTVGRRVVEEAARRLADGKRRHPGRRIAVNLSLRELTDVGHLRMLRLVPSRFGLHPGSLELEVDEAAFSADSARLREALELLQQAGFRLAVSGFGVARVRLADLAALPIARLKTHRSLVRGISDDPGRSSVLAGALGLASALRVELLAEGVERAGEVAALRALGYRLAQGWLFGGPLADL